MFLSPMGSMKARDIADVIMKDKPTQHELVEEFGLPLKVADWLLRSSAEYFGPGGKRYDAFVKLVDKTLKKEGIKTGKDEAMSTHKFAAELAKTDPKLAYDMVLSADEPLPVGAGEPLPEASKQALINSLGTLRTAIRYMNQGNYPNMVKALAGVVNSIGATMHAFSDLGPEADKLLSAGSKLLKSKGEVKRVKLAEVASSNPKLAFEMFLAADGQKDDEDDEDKGEKGKAFPGAAPPFEKKDE